MKSQCWVIAGNQILKSEYFQIHVAVIKRKNGRKHVYLDEGPTGYCRPVMRCNSNLVIYYSNFICI